MTIRSTVYDRQKNKKCYNFFDIYSLKTKYYFMKHVTLLKHGKGRIIHQNKEGLPSIIYITSDKQAPIFLGKNSCYIFIKEASVDASLDIYKEKSYPLTSGSIIRTPVGRKFRLHGVQYGIIIERLGINEIFQINPSLEEVGRLKYIDGCTDTLVIAPTKWGMPTLSALYFPKHTKQSQHTHPSYRIGMVVSGNGICKTPNESLEMKEGDVIIVHKDGLHSFETQENEMVLISFHPDSEFGPKDDDHPMINKTLIDGISASHITQIHTN